MEINQNKTFKELDKKEKVNLIREYNQIEPFSQNVLLIISCLGVLAALTFQSIYFFAGKKFVFYILFLAFYMIWIVTYFMYLAKYLKYNKRFFIWLKNNKNMDRK